MTDHAHTKTGTKCHLQSYFTLAIYVTLRAVAKTGLPNWCGDWSGEVGASPVDRPTLGVTSVTPSITERDERITDDQ